VQTDEDGLVDLVTRFCAVSVSGPVANRVGPEYPKSAMSSWAASIVPACTGPSSPQPEAAIDSSAAMSRALQGASRLATRRR
jgi:hypothetical protein